MRLRRFLPHIALAVIGAASFAFDQPVQDLVRRYADRDFERLMGLVGDWGDWPELMAFSFLVWLAAGFWKRNELRRMIVIMAVGSTLSGLAVNTLRLTTGRTRPGNKDVPQGFYGLRHEDRWLVGRHKFNSFPSGHMATASGYVLPVVFLRGLPAAPLLAFPALMAVARIVTDAHHFSDTVCSFIISVWVCLALVRSRFVRGSPSGRGDPARG